MKRKQIMMLLLLITGAMACNQKAKSEEPVQEPEVVANKKIKELKVKSLLRDSLELAPNLEVIVSYVEVPPNTALPKHYHPGEEFAYLLEGSGEVSLEGSPKAIARPGEASKIPFKKIHSFRALDKGAKFIVFRVHEKGSPERVLVEE